MVEAVLRAALAPLADGLGADAVAPGQDAGGLVRAGDLGADRRGGASIRVDLPHGSSPSRPRGPEALEAGRILYDGPPDRVPAMLRDQTPSTAVSDSELKPSEINSLAAFGSNWGKFPGTQVQHWPVRLGKAERPQDLPPLPLGVHLAVARESAPVTIRHVRAKMLMLQAFSHI
jgi:hypothetical protein